MRYVLTLGVSLFVLASAAEVQKPPLLPEKMWRRWRMN